MIDTLRFLGFRLQPMPPSFHQPPPSPGVSGKVANVLLVLNERERGIFLPRVDASARANAGKWVESSSVQDPEAWLHLLNAFQPTVLVSSWSTPPLPTAFINQRDCPLAYVCHLGGAVRHLLPRQFLERGGIVTNWGTAAAAQVAEHALLLTLASLRKLPAWRPASPAANGSGAAAAPLTETLFGRRVGLHGCGGVARHFARLIEPFGARVSCWSAGVPEAVIRGHGMTPAASLDDLCRTSDIVVACEALTPANRLAVGAAQLALLPDGAHFVNVGRGHLVDESALLREVLAGRLHVALDVMWTEPLPADSPWWSAPHTVLSPHIAGPTRDETPLIGLRAWENLQRFLAGQPVEPVVTLEIYDRST